MFEYNLYYEHVNTFSPDTIRLLLKKLGFKIIKSSNHGYVTDQNLHHPWISLVARKCAIPSETSLTEDFSQIDYLQVLSGISKYRKSFHNKHGRFRVTVGLIRDSLMNRVKRRPLINQLLRPFWGISGLFLYQEPNYCTSSKLEKFPKDECSYYD